MFGCQLRSMARVKWKSISSTSLCVSLWNSMARSTSPIQKPTGAFAGRTDCCSRTAISFCDSLSRMSARISMEFWISYFSLLQDVNTRSPTLCAHRKLLSLASTSCQRLQYEIQHSIEILADILDKESQNEIAVS